MTELVCRRRKPRAGRFYIGVGCELACYRAGETVAPLEYRFRSDAERSLRHIKTIWPKAKVVKG